ncbi:Uncharacterised protein [Escherichia coli]|uniref:Uncharacterized protein n=1 Tax=Escherichia coli TaxID=562 RepID=A0A376MUZ3_ECOLX|nr:Uncharacterised protein [Escherichia coli]
MWDVMIIALAVCSDRAVSLLLYPYPGADFLLAIMEPFTCHRQTIYRDMTRFW